MQSRAPRYEGRDTSTHPTVSPLVWQVVRQRGRERFFVKQAADRTAYQREIHAYQNHIPTLGAASAPRLYSTSHRLQTLITTAVPGTPVARARLAATTRVEVYRKAGSLLARLHHARPSSPETRANAQKSLTHIAGAVARRVDGVEGLSVQDRQSVLSTAQELCRTERLPLGFVHGNPHEWHWVWSEQSQLALVDFGRSRFAPVIVDLVPFACRWLDVPALKAGFYRGYGRHLLPEERNALNCLVTLHAANRLIHGTVHGDEQVTTYGRRLLGR
ncbi:aminoglycoside phosphotransferase family protein [Streptomyces niveiscabiei]|uniref:aminoglycoside phosphotransferase family protein n=1 Tax=Streptomyces niveiscabiei TaxID=164115 RepID=UPI0029B5D388|nr:aminoglycoside phosphotransferase family protein [Streptomyces niveiscabiei]MDX3387148.1 aminoglycoside phosphotransferase family protein [Streptomyces niveiscabiei]